MNTRDNFFGVIRVTPQVFPGMRKRKSGTIVGGRIGFPVLSAYIISKFVCGLSESMSYELKPFGIKVEVVVMSYNV
ncbi:MAG: SDR family NAD(P)-dependent oxidoreductase [Nitrososphaeraceae archaeon]